MGKRIDELNDEINDLYEENRRLEKTVDGDYDLGNSTQNKIAQNRQTIQTLKTEFGILRPMLADIDTLPEDMKRLKVAKWEVFTSDLPWYQLYTNHDTATLEIIMDIDLSYPGVEKDVRDLTKDAPIEITYAKNTFRFLSACDTTTTTTESCDPLAVGAKDENSLWTRLHHLVRSLVYWLAG